MKFEVGKFYRTRDGRKAQIFMLDNGKGLMIGAVLIDGNWLARVWNNNSGSSTLEFDRDLVSEWREPIKKVMEVYINKDKTIFELDFISQIFTLRIMSPNKTEYFDTKARITVEEVLE